MRAEQTDRAAAGEVLGRGTSKGVFTEGVTRRPAKMRVWLVVSGIEPAEPVQVTLSLMNPGKYRH